VVTLQDLFPKHLQDELDVMLKRWSLKRISLELVAVQLASHVRTEGRTTELAPMRAADARRIQRLRERFLSVLEAVRQEYRRDGGWRARIVKSPIESHVRSILAYYKRVERDPTKGRRPDPLLIPLALHGPSSFGTREALAELGVSRRDITWLLANARQPE